MSAPDEAEDEGEEKKETGGESQEEGDGEKKDNEPERQPTESTLLAVLNDNAEETTQPLPPPTLEPKKEEEVPTPKLQKPGTLENLLLESSNFEPTPPPL